MFDLLALSYQADVTRVFTFLVGQEFSTQTFPRSACPTPHHASRIIRAIGNVDEGSQKSMPTIPNFGGVFPQKLRSTRTVPATCSTIR